MFKIGSALPHFCYCIRAFEIPSVDQPNCFKRSAGEGKCVGSLMTGEPANKRVKENGLTD